jgi:5'-phosphate synthase pdxT subunit
MIVGVLALQGDFLEHRLVLRRLGIEDVEVRLPEHLVGLDALIIPGGESTAIGKLATSYDLMDPVRAFARNRPIWGTCAGAIFLSKDVRREQPLLRLMDITIERNAFGRQIDSFVTHLQVPALEAPEKPFEAVFIRAPLIESVGKDVEVLAQLPQDWGRQANIVAARQGHLLATSFHPELTDDDRFHRYFLALAQGDKP